MHTGGWLSRWLVLISSIAFRSVDGARETFDIALTRQQGEASARSDGDPYDWDGLGLWGAGMDPRMASLCAVDAINGVTVTARPPTGAPHLRSARAGIDDASQARNGDLGHADACIVDDES